MDFQPEKSFGKLRLRVFQPYHQTLCILKIIMISDVSDINSITALRCTCSISDISDMLKWQIKNEVLMDRQKEVKRNKIQEFKATRKDLMKQVEGWRVR